jgi:hypothetical protein
VKDTAAEKASNIANAAKETIDAAKQKSQQVKDKLSGQRRDAEL